MKCQKVIVMLIYSMIDPEKGPAPQLREELDEAGISLTRKVNNKGLQQEVLNWSLDVADDPDKTNSKYKFSPEDIKKIGAFAKDSDDLGMYLIVHSDHGHFAGGLSGTELGKLIGTLNIKIKKINVVACNADSKQKGQTDSALLEFCKALTMDEKPIVAGYAYAVFVNGEGAKLYLPKGAGAKVKTLVQDGMKAGTKVKVAYKFEKGKWAKTELEKYKTA